MEQKQKGAEEMDNEPKLKSLEKTFKILECFTSEEPGLGITEISHRLGLYKSNVHNILTTLERMGYIEQDSETSKYYLGRKFIKISHAAMSAAGFNSRVRQYLREISAMVEETVYYGVPDGHSVIYLDGAYPDASRNTNIITGITAPLVCTGIGKAILAFKDDAFIEAVLADPLERFTDNTITDPAVLRENLAQTKARGYSIDDMEHEYGIKCVGVPVLNRFKEVMAGISVTGPSLRFGEERILEIAGILKKKVTALASEV
ncbi:IclR family transcriptional regulator [Breznakiella homolactica]|uniref:IclR family transcriptional regulator n=1 Tax=Breznakiella homolactica TaxID=2798577 RepID=A0A7T7XK53_9SPIR|nr:IclR family transcriptional regulator [Breznakiella homolactica]QQO07899.1 IclR family transcriptional regulator [Breznakiella homolactica]